MKKTTICKTFTFAAAHRLPYHKGLCNNLHGHNYKLEVEVSAAKLHNGMVIDFADLKSIVKKAILQTHDHVNLNDYYTNPTAEVMAQNIFGILNGLLWDTKKICLDRVRLWETDTSWAQVEQE